MTLTPHAQLIQDLADPMPEAASVASSEWMVDTDLSAIEPHLPGLIDAAHLRVRGMRAVTITLPGADGMVPAAALRSAPGSAGACDFGQLWSLGLNAAYGKPKSVAEVVEFAEVSVAERLDRAYPGITLESPHADLFGQYTLYARGTAAVQSLSRLLAASIRDWPLPSKADRQERELFVRLLRDRLDGS
ncbi:hypothetical protein [Streptomyces albidoflavus]|uniref:hypothetical protein n=1 Tax=Streptomyces albidoflavus TaxID=1886 RepID=UPI00101E91B0|nr:hypothetical protein [Streptomyces albidoflavus]RZF02876.1 hypothetical protein C0R05_32190 [Streptomyces albidoflavus]